MMRKHSIPSFIEKAWEILQQEKYTHILRWSEAGSSFLILDESSLCKEVLPQYFKHSNFSSFIRQLNMYNFHKKKGVDNCLEFYHRLFRKDQRQLLIGIKRKPSEAEIEFGEELIRKMTLKTPSSQQRSNSSRENSICSDENVNSNISSNSQHSRDLAKRPQNRNVHSLSYGKSETKDSCVFESPNNISKSFTATIEAEKTASASHLKNSKQQSGRSTLWEKSFTMKTDESFTRESPLEPLGQICQGNNEIFPQSQQNFHQNSWFRHELQPHETPQKILTNIIIKNPSPDQQYC